MRNLEDDLKLCEAATITIPLTKGFSAIIDAEDFEVVPQYKWYASKCSTSNYYAITNLRVIDGVGGRLYLHRLVSNAPKGIEADHISGDTLDNRKCNLRLATHQINQMNKNGSSGGTSRFKGVGWEKRRNLWRVQIKKDGKPYWGGYFKSEIEAARAYDDKALELFGEYARLNFPSEVRNAG